MVQVRSMYLLLLRIHVSTTQLMNEVKPCCREHHVPSPLAPYPYDLSALSTAAAADNGQTFVNIKP